MCKFMRNRLFLWHIPILLASMIISRQIFIISQAKLVLVNVWMLGLNELRILISCIFLLIINSYISKSVNPNFKFQHAKYCYMYSILLLGTLIYIYFERWYIDILLFNNKINYNNLYFKNSLLFKNRF